MRVMSRIVGIVLLAVGMAAAQVQNAAVSNYPTRFEVASVRMLERPAGDGFTKISDPGALLFTAHNASLDFLMQMAFGVQDYQIEGQPAWMESTVYDVSAKPDSEKGPTYDQLKPMLQQLLAQRFHLQTHAGEKEMKGYSLVVAKGGQRLRASRSEGSVSAFITANKLQAAGVDMKGLAAMLTLALKQPVKDDTGIGGSFDVKLDYAPLGAMDSSLPSIFTAVQEQLGLRLEPAKVPVQMVVIDHVDRVPTEN